jgi:hypothetical protein
MYIDNKKWGQVRWGLTATPIYNITKDTNVTELEDDMHSDNRMNQAFFLRPKGSNTEAGLSNLRWSDISRCYDSSNAFVCSTRKNGVAYWSPEWYGFTASWGWFEDDMWGEALRYKKEWGENWDVGAGVGYEKTTDERLLIGGGFAGFRPTFRIGRVRPRSSISRPSLRDGCLQLLRQSRQARRNVGELSEPSLRGRFFSS